MDKKDFVVVILESPLGFVFEHRAKNAKYQPGRISGFGGHVEKGEQPRRAIIRELLEETTMDAADFTNEELVELGRLSYKDERFDHQTTAFKLKIGKDIKGVVGQGTVILTRDALSDKRNDLTYFTGLALEKFKDKI